MVLPQESIQAFVGVVLSLIVELIKSIYKKSSGTDMPAAQARWITFGLCFIAGTAITIYNGTVVAPPSDPLGFISWVGVNYAVICASATTFYGAFVSESTRLVARKAK